MTRTARSDQETHDHYARNARVRGHAETCDMVAGTWTTIRGVGVNWPTIAGRPACTCDRQRSCPDCGRPDTDHLTRDQWAGDTRDGLGCAYTDGTRQNRRN